MSGVTVDGGAVEAPTAPPVQHRETCWNLRPGHLLAPDLFAWHRLGGGDVCEAWLAWSRLHWSPVVVKIARPEFRDSERARRHVQREADRLTELVHPAFQRLLLARPDHHPPYLVLSYAEGPTLSAMIDQQPLGPAEFTLFAMGLVSAVRYLHRKGVVHLDLKPSNVVVADGRVVLLDLELAAVVGHHFDSGAMPGTLGYMAPEQLRGEPVAPPMDMFAIGALLHEAVTGRPVFDTPDTRLDRQPQVHARAPLLDPETLGPDLTRLVDLLLEPDPAQRPDCDAVLIALQAALPDPDESLWPDWAADLLGR